MSRTYDRRLERRERERQRSLMGETLAEYHRRENPPRDAPGAGIPRVRCPRTPSLFDGDRGNGRGVSTYTGDMFSQGWAPYQSSKGEG